jgi:glutaredoxin-like YruB-family protein
MKRIAARKNRVRTIMATEHNVTIYTTKTCQYCHMVKDWLKKKGIPYREIDVGADQKAATEMVEKSGQMGVPVIEFDGKIIIGFDQRALLAAIGA